MEFSIALAVRGRKRRDPIRSTALGLHAGSSGLLARGPRRLGGALVLLLALAAPASAQVSFDRPGGDYTNFAVRSGDPAACASRCERDPRCRAWTYSRPGYYGGPAARCFFKDRVTLPRHDPCCISGVVR